MIRKTPSFSRLIQVDYPSIMYISWPIIVWIFFLISFVIGVLLGFQLAQMLFHPGLISALFFAGLVVSVLMTPLLIRRYLMFQDIFTRGEEVEGKLHGVGFSRDRGILEVQYIYAGKEYTSRSSVQKMDRTKELKPGISVFLIVDQARPDRAFIKDLYI